MSARDEGSPAAVANAFDPASAKVQGPRHAASLGNAHKDYLAIIEDGKDGPSGALDKTVEQAVRDALKDRDKRLVNKMTSFFREELRHQVRVLQRQSALLKERNNALGLRAENLEGSLARRHEALDEERRVHLQQLLLIKELHFGSLATSRDPVDLKHIRSKATQQLATLTIDAARAVLSRNGIRAEAIDKVEVPQTDAEDESRVPASKCNSNLSDSAASSLEESLVHQKLQQAVEKNERLAAELQTRKDFLRTLQQERDQQKRQHEAALEELRGELAAMQTEIKTARASAAAENSAEAQSVKLAEALAEAQNHILGQNETLAKYQDDLRSVQRSAAKLDKELASAKELNDKLNAQLVEAMQQARSNVEALQQQQQRQDQLQKELEASNSAVKSAQVAAQAPPEVRTIADPDALSALAEQMEANKARKVVHRNDSAESSQEAASEKPAAQTPDVSVRRQAKPKIPLGRRRRSSVSLRRSSSGDEDENVSLGTEQPAHETTKTETTASSASTCTDPGVWMTAEEHALWTTTRASLDAELERTCTLVCKLERDLDDSLEDCNAAWETAERIEKEKVDLVLALNQQEQELATARTQAAAAAAALATMKSGLTPSLRRSLSVQRPQMMAVPALRAAKSSASLLHGSSDFLHEESVPEAMAADPDELGAPHVSQVSSPLLATAPSKESTKRRPSSAAPQGARRLSCVGGANVGTGAPAPGPVDAGRGPSRWAAVLKKSAQSTSIVGKMRELKRKAAAHRSESRKSQAAQTAILEASVRRMRHELAAARLALGALHNAETAAAGQASVVRDLLAVEYESEVADQDRRGVDDPSERAQSLLSLGLDLLSRECGTDAALGEVASEHFKVMLNSSASGLHASIPHRGAAAPMSPVLAEIFAALDRLAIAARAWRELRHRRVAARWRVLRAKAFAAGLSARRRHVLLSAGEKHPLAVACLGLETGELAEVAHLEHLLQKLAQQGYLLRRLLVQLCARVATTAGACKAATESEPLIDVLTRRAEPLDAVLIREAREDLARSVMQRAEQGGA